jgi:hypothetical protein
VGALGDQTRSRAASQGRKGMGAEVADRTLEELLVSSEVQTAHDRLEDYLAAETAAQASPNGDQELKDLRDALVEMPGAVRMLIEAIDRAGVTAGQPQHDPGDTAAKPGSGEVHQ